MSNSPVGNMIIKVDLDATGFNKSMTGLNRQIRSVNTELRANLSQFDRNERSVKKYETQIDSLSKRHQLQEKAVESSRKEYEKMVEQYGEGSAKAEAAAIKVNENVALYQETGRELNNLRSEFRDFQREQEIQASSWYKAGTAIDNFSGKLSSISGDMKRIGGTLTKSITTPIAGLIATVGGMGFKRAMDIEQVQMMMEHISDDSAEYEKRMKNVVDLVTDTRFGTAELGAEYAKFIGASASDASANLYSQVAMNLSAFKMDDQLIPQIGDLFTKALQSGKIDGTMINQFTNAGVDIIKVLGNKWGMSTDAVRERLRSGSIDIHEVLNELSEGILEGTEGELGATKAMGGMLEKSGQTLSGQIKNFFAAISQAGERLIKDTGLFDGVKDSLDELRNMLKSGELDTILIPTFRGMAKVLEALIETLRKIFKWFSNLDDSTKGLIGTITGLSLIIGPILVGLGTLGGIVVKLITPFGTLFKLVAQGGGLFKSLGGIIPLLTNPITIAIGIIALLATGFTLAYKKSETFRNFIHNLGDKIKEVFGKLKEFIQPAIDAVVGFFNNIKEKIVEFINNEGAGILQAFKNIGSVIAIVASAIWTAIQWCFNQIMSIVNFVMPAIEFVISLVWGNIKGLITGALDIIMGAVKVFSGLFTGDFGKMWEGIKQMFMGAITAVWNYINLLFIGRIIKSVAGFVGLFRNNITTLWNAVTRTFSNSISNVWNFVRNGFNNIFNTIRSTNATIRNTIQNIWTAILNYIRNLVTNLYTTVRNTFSNMRDGVVNLVSSARTGIVNQWNRIRSSVTELASKMWTSVRDTFNKMVNGAKNLPGRIGTGIRNAAGRAANAMKSMGNRMLSALEKPINGMIGGVNWVTGKLGVKKKIEDVKLPRYARGTPKGGHSGGMAIVGDGGGRELIKLPTGQSFLSPSTDTLIDLPKGTHVVPHKQTELILKSQLPHYAKGTKGWSSIIGDVWNYVKNPSRIVSKIISGLGIGAVTGFAKDLGSAAWNFVKTKPIDYIKNLFSQADSGGKPVFGYPITSPFGMRTHPITGQRRLHGGVDFGMPHGTPVPSTTGGTVSFAGHGWNGGFGNLVKVKQGVMEYFYAHLSQILVRAGQSITKGTIIGRVGSTGASTGAHLHYEARRNGVRINPMSLKGYATGGLINSKQLAWLGEEGQEMVIPLAKNRRSDAMKLLALTARMLDADGRNSGSLLPRQLPNTNQKSNDDNEQLMKLLIEQNAHLKQSNDLLTQLLNKNTTIELDGQKIGDFVDSNQSANFNIKSYVRG